MIKEYNGNVLTSAGIISSELTLNIFKKTKLFNEMSDFVDHQNGHSNYTFRNIKIDHHDFNFTLYFHNNKLIIVSLFCLLEPVNKELSWCDWSLDKEQKRRELHNKLLKRWLGKGEVNSNYLTYEFDWGIIDSKYDSRSGSSNISINYR